MDAKTLVDAIVRQTTVLIAQLSTSAGIRAPLAHIADQVFLDLSREIEAQGVSRKVAADMFGLAIRSYQKKVNRLSEGVTDKEDTVWGSVLTYLQRHGSVSKRVLLESFPRYDLAVVGSVLNDLVSSGFVYKTGSSDSAIYGITKDQDLSQIVSERGRESLAPIVWILVYRSGSVTLAELTRQLSSDTDAIEAALTTLAKDGRVIREGEGPTATYRATTFLVPLNTEIGWEAAVFDQYQTVVRAIGTKLRLGAARAATDDVVGGATLSFDINDGHPHRQEVLGLLKRVRGEVNELWDRVEAYNADHPIAEEDKTEVSFYFGQCVTPPDEEQ